MSMALQHILGHRPAPPGPTWAQSWTSLCRPPDPLTLEEVFMGLEGHPPTQFSPSVQAGEPGCPHVSSEAGLSSAACSFLRHLKCDTSSLKQDLGISSGVPLLFKFQ